MNMAVQLIKIMILLSVTTVLPVSVSIVHPLQRISRSVKPNDLVRADETRHTNSVNSTTYPLQGSFEIGMYVARVQIGTPAYAFNLAMDTGSNDLWISSSICTGSPSTLEIGLQGEPNFYDLATTTSGSLLSCKDQLCTHCSHKKCTYSTTYNDGGRASGYYVKDIIHFDSILTGSAGVNFSAEIAFGVTDYRSGSMSMAGVDGLLGLGLGHLSIISQLSSTGKMRKIFSHCLTGEGGGSLMIGKAPVHQKMVYSPMVSSVQDYFLNLRSISVNKRVLPMSPEALKKSGELSNVVYTGTKYAIFVEEAFGPLVNMINAEVSNSVTVQVLEDRYCYLIPNSDIYNNFPDVSLNFDGGASWILKPRDYLEDSGSHDGAVISCLGFQSSPTAKINILGVTILKDRIVTYDLEQMRVGWTEYFNCSLPMEETSEPSLSPASPVPMILISVLCMCTMAFLML